MSNLIPVNEVAETGYRRTAPEAVKRFCEILSAEGINATVRRKLGSDINASCGQLRRSSLAAENAADDTVDD